MLGDYKKGNVADFWILNIVGNIYIYSILSIEFKANQKNMRLSRRNPQLPISVLNLPPKSSFIEVPILNSEYRLCYVEGKKVMLQAYKIQVQKTKLFNNLEIYEWRYHTQFPIVKTKYVSIQPSHSQALQHDVQLIVFIEHCPLKLSAIFQMSMGQTLYMLKQAIIGFERLYSRFGAFEVSENMIGINQKGLCRVWHNQSFPINSFTKPELSEQAMVSSIVAIMGKHCLQNGVSKILLEKLKPCKSFLSSLKQIDSFVVSENIQPPTRYVMAPYLKEIPSQFEAFNKHSNANQKELVPQQHFRYSINSAQNMQKQDQQQVNTDEIGKFSNQHQKMKYENKLKGESFMKISSGQTAYTRNIKCSNTGYHNSTFMGEDFKTQDRKKDKKQLSYSEANQSKTENCFYRFQSSMRKSQNEAYTHQFISILESNNTDSPSTSRYEIMEEDDDEEKLREEHSENIMKSNGWNTCTGLMSINRQMKKSFHEGQDQCASRGEIKFLKLDNINKRQIALSILPEEGMI